MYMYLELIYLPIGLINGNTFHIYTLTTYRHRYNESSWGWNEKEKYRELSDDRARFLLARNQQRQLVGYVHFRFDIEETLAVVYWFVVIVTMVIVPLLTPLRVWSMGCIIV